MNMIAKMMVIAALAAWGFQGCSSLLFKSTPAPVFFQLDYRPVAVDCPKSFPRGVKVRELGASSPYDQRGMVVIEKGQRVSHSGSYQWVSSPGKLIADSLLRDLNAGNLFPQVTGPNSAATTPLELTGHVFGFAWEKADAEYRANLHLELSLIDTSAERKVILRKNYQLTSTPYTSNTPDNFARAMASVMSQVSKELQEDLCRQVAGG